MGGEVHISRGVKAIDFRDDRAAGLSIDAPNGGVESRDYDAIIATTPSYVFTRLAPMLPASYASKLTNVTYLSAVLMILELDRPLFSHLLAQRCRPLCPVRGCD